MQRLDDAAATRLVRAEAAVYEPVVNGRGENGVKAFGI